MRNCSRKFSKLFATFLPYVLLLYSYIAYCRSHVTVFTAKVFTAILLDYFCEQIFSLIDLLHIVYLFLPFFDCPCALSRYIVHARSFILFYGSFCTAFLLYLPSLPVSPLMWNFVKMRQHRLKFVDEFQARIFICKKGWIFLVWGARTPPPFLPVQNVSQFLAPLVLNTWHVDAARL